MQHKDLCEQTFSSILYLSEKFVNDRRDLCDGPGTGSEPVLYARVGLMQSTKFGTGLKLQIKCCIKKIRVFTYEE